MYIFVTYGIPGWRGVQERGLAIAQEFPKNEVLFLNGYDSEFIKKRGFRVKTINTSLTNPAKIQFPANTKALVFADLPTNELFNFSLFLAAKKRGLPVIVIDQIYRRGQTKEGVYNFFSQIADLMLLNGLTLFKKEESKNIKIIPPLADYRKEIPKEELRKKLSKIYQLDDNKLWVFVAGYYPPLIKMTQKALNKNLLDNAQFIITKNNLKKHCKKNGVLFVPYLPNKEYLKWIEAVDLFISKLGYLQITEAIALRTPTILTGEGGLVLKLKILDQKLRKCLIYAETWQDLKEKLEHFILKDRNELKRWREKLKNLHDGKLGGAKIAANYIKAIKNSRKIKNKKTLLIASSNDLKIIKKGFLNRFGLYSLFLITPLSMPGPELSPIKRLPLKITNLALKKFYWPNHREILPHDFKEIILFSPRKYDGLLDILPWYSVWLENLLNFLKSADKILLTPTTQKLLENFLKPFSKKIIILKP
jgi:UDP-N-acetylglucosamine:LPS N-acetylglucosamine transferase